jgi:lipopolysaccharide transport protein LptA/LPS export ABC transporter protein LptC
MHPHALKFLRRSLIGIAIAVILLVAANYLQVWYRRARLVKKVAQILSPEMLRSFEGFEYSSTPNGVLRFRLKAKRLIDTRQGKSYIEGIEAYDFNPDGSIRNSIRSINGMFDSERNRAEFSGDVRISLGDEFELRMNSLQYDLGARRGETRDRIQFVSKIASGTATGVIFDQSKKNLELERDVDFVLNATDAAAGGAAASRQFHAAADQAVCTDDMNRVVFRGHARVDSNADVLSGDRIEAVLSSDRKRLVSLISAGNASYDSEKAGESQRIRGDRMVFGIGQAQTLEKVNVTGQAEFLSEASSGTQALNGQEIDVLFDAATANPLSVEGRGSVSFLRNSDKEKVRVSGNTFAAGFSPGSKNLNRVAVRGQAVMSIEDVESATRNELMSEEIRLSFRDTDGRPVFDRLRAEGTARWVSGSNPKKATRRREPERTLEASQLEMVFARGGDSFESGSASGNVTISETRSDAGNGPQLSRLRTDSAQFHFFPGNKIRNVTASGHVLAGYEKYESTEKTAPQKFSAASDSLEAVFALRNGESAIESAAQWGNFVYRDASMTATAGRCEYDARSEILVLKESPRISDEMSSTSGERMEYELKQKAVIIFGRVRSKLNSKNSAGSFMARSSSASPAIITADEMRYWTAERRARYTRKVQVLSENAQLQAGRLDIIEGGDRLEAQEDVRLYLPQRGASKTGEPTDKVKEKKKAPTGEMTIQSSNLKYEKQKNTVNCGGHVTVRSGDVSLSSDTLEAVLAENGSGMEHATARGQVRIRQNDTEGKADVAEYYLNPHKFVLTGNPAEINEPGKVRSSAAQLTYFIADDRILFGNR